VQYPEYDIDVLGRSWYRYRQAGDIRTGINKAVNDELVYQDYANSPDFDSVAHAMLLEKMGRLFDHVSYTKHFSKPGFQIVNDSAPRTWHYDNEKLTYPYQKEFADYQGFDYFDRVFTITIMISDGNFSYDYFPESQKYGTPQEKLCKHHEWLIGDDCPNCPLGPYSSIKYGRGDLVLSEDRCLHRVGASQFAGSKRITLQGQAVVKDNIFYMYW
jgi:hypothetical protein